MSFFDRPRGPHGDRAIVLRIGPLEIELAGLDGIVASRLTERFERYVADEAGAEALRVAVRAESVEFFIDPPERPEFNPVLLACEGKRVRYLGYQVAGWFDTTAGEGRMLLARGAYEPPERAVENYLRAAVAWQAAERGGALVHGAGAVLDGGGYLFYGPSGAGKSTLSACNRRATVVSDDLSLVLPGEGGAPALVGSPFRGTYEEGEAVVGSFPLAAGFRIVKDVKAEVRSAPRVRAVGELVGNLPFVAESFGRRPDLFAAIERSFAGVPLAHLHFRKDESYWDAILEWRRAGRGGAGLTG